MLVASDRCKHVLFHGIVQPSALVRHDLTCAGVPNPVVSDGLDRVRARLVWTG